MLFAAIAIQSKADCIDETVRYSVDRDFGESVHVLVDGKRFAVLLAVKIVQEIIACTSRIIPDLRQVLHVIDCVNKAAECTIAAGQNDPGICGNRMRVALIVLDRSQIIIPDLRVLQNLLQFPGIFHAMALLGKRIIQNNVFLHAIPRLNGRKRKTGAIDKLPRQSLTA